MTKTTKTMKTTIGKSRRCVGVAELDGMMTTRLRAERYDDDEDDEDDDWEDD